MGGCCGSERKDTENGHSIVDKKFPIVYGNAEYK
jgi:hypothetical protein